MNRFRFSKEPAIWIGFLIAVGEALRDAPTYRDALPLIAGILIRFFVSPAEK